MAVLAMGPYVGPSMANTRIGRRYALNQYPLFASQNMYGGCLGAPGFPTFGGGRIPGLDQGGAWGLSGPGVGYQMINPFAGQYASPLNGMRGRSMAGYGNPLPGGMAGYGGLEQLVPIQVVNAFSAQAPQLFAPGMDYGPRAMIILQARDEFPEMVDPQDPWGSMLDPRFLAAVQPRVQAWWDDDIMYNPVRRSDYARYRRGLFDGWYSPWMI
ncbi:hypothetical protein H2203_001725 [Taxawa tesnikishii (nom. ined.)]|nr:hypothetical protein H2203_001725 [Dothideales sp. JES 119]